VSKLFEKVNIFFGISKQKCKKIPKIKLLDVPKCSIGMFHYFIRGERVMVMT